MLLTGISLLGWAHSLACLIAVFAGAYVLMARKGTRWHRFWGWWYAMAMVAQGLIVMAIYRSDMLPGLHPKLRPDLFGFFHYGELLLLAVVALALFSASRQRRRPIWAYIHSQSMLFSYYLLSAGLINEMYARIGPCARLRCRYRPMPA